MDIDIKKSVLEEFTGENAQLLYVQKAKEGLWLSEDYFIKNILPSQTPKFWILAAAPAGQQCRYSKWVLT